MKHQFDITAIIKDKRGQILSIGKNSYIKTHPNMHKLVSKLKSESPKRVFLHAEIDAINKCLNLDKAHIIEVYAYDHIKKCYKPSQPCVICYSGIAMTPIKYIQYVNSKKQIVIEPNTNSRLKQKLWNKK